MLKIDLSFLKIFAGFFNKTKTENNLQDTSAEQKQPLFRPGDVVLFGGIREADYGVGEIQLDDEGNVVWHSKDGNDYSHDIVKRSDIERRKAALTDVFVRWGIDINQLFDCIENNCPLAGDDAKNKLDANSNLYDEIRNCVLYLEEYGKDALIRSSHRWAFKDAILPLMVERKFYKELSESDKKAYDALPIGQRSFFQMQHNLEKKVKDAETQQAIEKAQDSKQEYLKITPEQIFAFAKEADLFFGLDATDKDFIFKKQITTCAMKVPQYTRVVNLNGDILLDTGAKETVAIFSPRKAAFVLRSDCRAYSKDLDCSFIDFLKLKTKFESCFTKEAMGLFWRYAERVHKAADKVEHDDNCANNFVLQQNKYKDTDWGSFNTKMEIYRDEKGDEHIEQDPKTGEGCIKDSFWQNRILPFVVGAVNDQKNYERLSPGEKRFFNALTTSTEQETYKRIRRWQRRSGPWLSEAQVKSMSDE